MSRITILALSAVGTLASTATAQRVLLDIHGAAGDGAAFGAAIGDWDGDGIPDIAIGAPSDSTMATAAGAARVYSGASGALLAQYFGVNANDYFGVVVARIPDLDGDGLDELAVGAPYADNSGLNTGSLFLYSGGTGALLLQIDGPTGDGGFGIAAGAIGDVDGDGIADLWITNGGGSDVVYVESGADGHPIARFTGASGSRFGRSVSVLDDLDGDGIPDLLVGAIRALNRNGVMVGAAFVVSTASGAILRRQHGVSPGEDFGDGTAALGDLDGDGVRDYAVGSWGGVRSDGLVRVYSGATGSELASIGSSGRDGFTSAVTDAGDLNGDGIEDLSIGGWTDTAAGRAAAFLFSGKTLLQIGRVDTDGVAIELAPFGDFDGDGLADLVVGTFASDWSGEVRVIAGDDLWITANPARPLAGDALTITTREGVPGALTLFALTAVDGAPTFQIVGGLTTFDATGGSAFGGTVPSGLAGHDLTFMAWAHDAAGHVIASAPDVVEFR